jgi:uncharacterized protein
VQAMGELRRALAGARSGRMRPHLDDKILTAWNGLMISALALAAQVLDESRYRDAACRAADFLLAEMWKPVEATLLRRYRAGEAAVRGFAEDYAFFAQGLLDLYEACFACEYLDAAARLTSRQLELFFDGEAGGFFSGEQDEHIVLRLKEYDDGAEPSANSVAALNLLRLALATGRDEFRDAAHSTLNAFGGALASQPNRAPALLLALGFHLGAPKQIVISGEKGAAGTEALLRVVRSRFLPHKVLLLGEESRWPRRGGATVYLCENFTCREPIESVARLIQLLE